MTLDDIRRIPRDFLTPREAAAYIGCAPYLINVQVKRDPSRLGFPAFLIGTRVRIPKQPFIRYMGGTADGRV